MRVEIRDIHLFSFAKPSFDFGQRVKTRDGLVGYIVGLDFHPETQIWSYGVYLLDSKDKLLEEIWFEAEQLNATSLEG